MREKLEFRGLANAYNQSFASENETYCAFDKTTPLQGGAVLWQDPYYTNLPEGKSALNLLKTIDPTPVN